MEQAPPPSDAQFLLEGSYYKKGLHDRMYRWSDGWMRTTRSAMEIYRYGDALTSAAKMIQANLIGRRRGTVS